MRNVVVRVVVAVTAALAIAACGSRSAGAAPPASQAPAAAAPSASHQATTTAAPRCAAGALVLGYGPMVSPMTGEHAVLYRIRNRGQVACSLAGYPSVRLYSASGSLLAFRYTHGHTEYVAGRRPTTVVLAPGGSGYVLVAKYRCDLGVVATAQAIRLTLPGPAPITLTGPAANARSLGAAGLSYCKGGAADPGQQVGVSAIEPTPAAAFARGAG